MRKRNFRIFLDPERFLNNVYAPSSLEEFVKDVNYIVSPRDIHRLIIENSKNYHLEVRLMKKEWLEAILRSVVYPDGTPAYEKASIRTGRVESRLLYMSQTFVQASKLLSLGGLQNLLRDFEHPGLSKLPSLVFILKTNGETYLAFYFQPIVEVWDAKRMIEIIEERLENLEREIILPGYFKDVKIYPREMVKEVLKDLKKISSLSLLRDGTHRAYTTYLAGTTLNVIVIQGVDGYTNSLPIKSIDDLVVTREKPKEKRYRFLGFDPKGWMNYQEVGIDG